MPHPDETAAKLPLQLEFLFEFTANLEPPLMLDRTPRGDRKVVYTTGGRIAGPQIQAEILPGGGDWFLLRLDGVGELDVRVVARLDDGELLYLTFSGFFVASQEIWGRIFAGETVDPSEYYYRVAFRFETGSGRYDWLNRAAAVGTGRVGPGVTSMSCSVYRMVWRHTHRRHRNPSLISLAQVRRTGGPEKAPRYWY